MNKKHVLIFSFVLPLMLASPSALAQEEVSDCVVLGAHAFDDRTKPGAGGSGMPPAAENRDYVRCQSCHGWDRLGHDGGFGHKERTELQPKWKTK